MAVLALMLAGCAGQKFSPVATVPSDKALIYIYRRSALGGIAGNHHIFANGQQITSLYNGSYFPYLAAPGTNYFSSRIISLSAFIDMSMNEQFKHRVCVVNAEAGKTYYVQFEIETTWGPKMKEVEPAVGEKAIQKCRLAKPLR